MIWDWGTRWEEDTPNQEQIVTLVKNLNKWRLCEGKEYLVYGRMMKPLPFDGAVDIPMITKPGRRNISFPSVFTSNWLSGKGNRSQFFVNYMPYEQEITLNLNGIKDVKIYREASDTKGESVTGKAVKLNISPFRAIMVSYSN
jgi:hypothetical protein